MPDIKDIMRRQAEWQQARAKLSWAEKVHAAERLRGDVLAMRKSATGSASFVPRSSR